MIDHIVIRVRDLATSRQFYVEALAPLGYSVVKEVEPFVGFGAGSIRDFWIGRGGPVTSGVHVAFACGSRSEVEFGMKRTWQMSHEQESRTSWTCKLNLTIRP